MQRARLRQVRRALARRRGWLAETHERTELLGRAPETKIEDEEEHEQQAPGYQQAALPQALPPDTRLDKDLEAEIEDEEEHEQQAPGYQQAALPQALPPDTRRAALFAVFDEMAEHREEFLSDGRPRVENVNGRLSTRGQQADATRREIDEAFAAWKQSRAPEAS